MSSNTAAATADESPTTTTAPWTADAVMDIFGIQRKPAEAIINHIDDWSEFESAIESDSDWTLLDGVGPATADSLDETAGELNAFPPARGDDQDEAQEAEDGEVSDDDEDEASDEPDVAPEDSDMNDDSDGDEEDDEMGEAEAEPDTDADPDEAAEDADDDATTDDGDGAESDRLPTFEKKLSSFAAVVEAGTLKDIVGQYTPIADEARIHLSEGGVRILLVDPANVVMRDGDYPASLFESYNTSEGRIGIDLNDLRDVIKMAGSDDLIHLELEAGKLNISMDGLEYTLALIDPESIREEPELPDLELPARFTIKQRELKRANKAADMVSDHVAVEARNPADGERAIIVKADGDTDDVKLTWTEDKDDIEDVMLPAAGEAFDSLFSLDYMKDIVRNISADTDIEVELGDEFPIWLRHNIDDDGETVVNTMLAPRIQSN